MPSSTHHETHEALELEFYVPAAVWDHAATRRLLTRVYGLVEGATLLGGAKGVWNGRVETTHIIRVVLRKAEVRMDRVLGDIRHAIDETMRAWAASRADRQDSFMFTVRELTLHEARLTANDG